MSTSVETSTVRVNQVVNPAVKSGHTPSPCPHSSLNTQAKEWWSDSTTVEGHNNRPSWQRQKQQAITLRVPDNWPSNVVYLTQNLVAPSIPEAIAERYVLSPSTSSTPEESEDAAPSTQTNLPKATHNDGQPDTLHTTSFKRRYR